MNQVNAKGIDMVTVMGALDEAYNDQNEDHRVMKNHHFQKRIGQMDAGINQMKEQQKQMDKAGKFNVFVGALGGLVGSALQFLDFLLPGLGSILNQFALGTTQTIQGLNPHYKKANQAQIEVQEHQRQAEVEAMASSNADEKANAEKESKRLTKERLAKAQDDLLQSRSIAVKA